MNSIARFYRDKKVLVTGAASGIGRSTALQLGQRGARLFLTDINQPGLQTLVDELRDQGAMIAQWYDCDLSNPHAVAAWAGAVTKTHGAMDIVMNIAGTSAWGSITDMPLDVWQQLVAVNLMGPIHVMREFLPPMIAAGGGGNLVNVSSAAGIIGMPWHSAYSATKFGLRGISEVLRFELAPAEIKVSLVCPGAVDTGLVHTLDITGVDQSTARFQRLQQRFQRRAISPDEAAARILKGVKRGRFWVFTSADIRAITALQRHFPPAYWVAMKVMHWTANRVLPEVLSPSGDHFDLTSEVPR